MARCGSVSSRSWRSDEQAVRFFERQARGSNRGPPWQVADHYSAGWRRLDWFKRQVDDAGGGSYQNLINQALRAHIERAEEPLEAILRRVVREELRRTG